MQTLEVILISITVLINQTSLHSTQMIHQLKGVIVRLTLSIASTNLPHQNTYKAFNLNIWSIKILFSQMQCCSASIITQPITWNIWNEIHQITLNLVPDKQIHLFSINESNYNRNWRNNSYFQIIVTVVIFIALRYQVRYNTFISIFNGVINKYNNISLMVI